MTLVCTISNRKAQLHQAFKHVLYQGPIRIKSSAFSHRKQHITLKFLLKQEVDVLYTSVGYQME